jgi:hypothetical protein
LSCPPNFYLYEVGYGGECLDRVIAMAGIYGSCPVEYLERKECYEMLANYHYTLDTHQRQINFYLVDGKLHFHYIAKSKFDLCKMCFKVRVRLQSPSGASHLLSATAALEGYYILSIDAELEPTLPWSELCSTQGTNAFSCTIAVNLYLFGKEYELCHTNFTLIKGLTNNVSLFAAAPPNN